VTPEIPALVNVLHGVTHSSTRTTRSSCAVAKTTYVENHAAGVLIESVHRRRQERVSKDPAHNRGYNARTSIDARNATE
jgi:hypothetical protein